jgi:hypothetical protein
VYSPVMVKIDIQLVPVKELKRSNVFKIYIEVSDVIIGGWKLRKGKSISMAQRFCASICCFSRVTGTVTNSSAMCTVTRTVTHCRHLLISVSSNMYM